MFKNAERFIKTIKTCVEHENYSVSFDKQENAVIFVIKNEIFENGGAKIKIPEQEQDLKTQVESLTKTVSELRKEIQNIKIKELEKDEAAVKSFKGSSFLKDEEKKLISKWIHPNKVIRFNMFLIIILIVIVLQHSIIIVMEFSLLLPLFMIVKEENLEVIPLMIGHNLRLEVVL